MTSAASILRFALGKLRIGRLQLEKKILANLTLEAAATETNGYQTVV